MQLKRYVKLADGSIIDTNDHVSKPLELIKNGVSYVATSDDIFELADRTWYVNTLSHDIMLQSYHSAYKATATHLYAPVGDDYICVWKRGKDND